MPKYHFSPMKQSEFKFLNKKSQTNTVNMLWNDSEPLEIIKATPLLKRCKHMYDKFMNVQKIFVKYI